MTALFSSGGKIVDASFQRTIYPQCGTPRNEVVAGPAYGVDVSIIQLPNGLDMALTSDPLSLIPTLGLQESAWLSVHLMANDMATTGVAPMYAQLVLNLPEHTTMQQFETYWQHIHQYCAGIGVAITGGHTGLAVGQHSTLAGGGTMVAIAPAGTMLLSSYAQPGDTIVLTQEAAMLSTAILAMSFPNIVQDQCGQENYLHACDMFYKTSSLEAGLAAAAFNTCDRGVSAMHDVTEGGVLGAIYEMAQAAGLGATVDADRIPVGVAQQTIARLFDLDPLYIVGAGAMIMSVAPDEAENLIHSLSGKGIRATAIGSFTSSKSVNLTRHGSGPELWKYPGADPYWAAYCNALNNGWT
ncbi:AIR synthase-related protein [Paraflavitalea pollutisoli]|uniref:AIR synthase-related protein n=1 Tax=Paraflavitalea pollutisoli TaxID=3034143 RepID=UPI0023ED193A|nr:AIR synthase-related protein [Paraflavitalea sp. H1-2-19X]